MDDEYYRLTSELDAREILRYLNNLGIHNISGEVLKYFITDLKKLIKYDIEKRYQKDSEEYEPQGVERLHSASTFCSRLRSRSSSNTIPQCTKQCQKGRQPLKMRNVHSAPVLGQQTKTQEEKLPRRACSCVREVKKTERIPKDAKETVISNANLIKVPKQPPKKKCDPVSLYHYYTTLWDKYKSNVPGENDWAELRWSIRQKMAGSTASTVNRVSEQRLRGKGDLKK